MINRITSKESERLKELFVECQELSKELDDKVEIMEDILRGGSLYDLALGDAIHEHNTKYEDALERSEIEVHNEWAS